MSDVTEGEAESAESNAPQASPLLTFIVGIVIIGLSFGIALSPLFERFLHH